MDTTKAKLQFEAVTPRLPVADVEKALAFYVDGRRGTAMAYIQVHGVDTYFSELKGKGFGAAEPQDQPYGMRDFEVVDPDGNRLAFGEPTES